MLVNFIRNLSVTHTLQRGEFTYYKGDLGCMGFRKDFQKTTNNQWREKWISNNNHLLFY